MNHAYYVSSEPTRTLLIVHERGEAVSPLCPVFCVPGEEYRKGYGGCGGRVSALAHR